MSTFENAPVPAELLRGTPIREEIEFRRASRRQVLMGGALAVGTLLIPAGAVAATNILDEAVNHMVYPGTESPILTIGYGDTPAKDLPYAPEAANVYAGLGQRPEVAHKMAVKLAGSPYDGKRLSYTAYAAQGLDVPNMTDEYEDLESTLDAQHVFCNSMGSVSWANVMGEKYQRLLAARPHNQLAVADDGSNPHAPKPIKTLTFCGSPFDVEDVYQAEAVKLISHYGLSGTMSQKFLAKLVLAINSNHQYRGIKNMLETAAQDTFDALPPKMWASQICQLGATSVGSFMRSFAGAITPDTLVMYLRPVDPRGDSVVKVEQASKRIGEFFTQNYGCQFEEVMMKDAGHADIDKACECPQFEDLLLAKSGLHI